MGKVDTILRKKGSATEAIPRLPASLKKADDNLTDAVAAYLRELEKYSKRGAREARTLLDKVLFIDLERIIKSIE